MALPDIPEQTADHTGELADLIDWQRVLARDPLVIGTKTGRLQTHLQILCPDTDHMQEPERTSYLARFHTVLMALNEDMILDADWWHEAATAYPESTWEHPVDWLVDETRRMRFEAEPRYESRTILTLNWRLPKPKRRWVRDLLLTKATGRAEDHLLSADLRTFQKGALRFADLLLTVLPDCRFLDANEVCTYYHNLTQWERYTVRCPSYPDHLDWQLSSGEWYPGQPPEVGGMLVQPITIKDWQDELGIFLPEQLTRLPFPLRWHLRWAPMGVQAADHYLRWEEKRWAGSYRRLSGTMKHVGQMQQQQFTPQRDERADAIAAGQGILAVQNEVLAGEEIVGRLMPTLLTWANDPVTLEEQVRIVTSVLFQQGLVAEVEKSGASIAWLASLAGNVHLGRRAFPLRTQELTGLIPHTHVWAGPESNRHLQGPPVLVASSDATPFRLVTHVGENGHMLVVGPARMGKSGLLGLFTRQWFRYPRAKMAIFDRDNAHKVSVLMRGGKHYALGTPGCSAFQPLARVDQIEERQWAMVWLEALLDGEGLTPTPQEREEMRLGLERLGTQPVQARTISLYRKLMQAPRLKIGLAPFCQGGLHSFFDGTEDAFGLQARLICFELAALLTQPRAVGPALAYIFHRLETQWFTGDPVALLVEEARWLLGMQQFLGEFEIWLKARAKMNVSVLIACQEIYDMAKTEAWQAIQSNVPTKIFLPNPDIYATTVRPFYDDMGLNDSEIAMVHRGQPRRDYLYKSPLGVRLFQVILSRLERLLCAASTLEELAILNQMIETVPPEELAIAWLRYFGEHEAAEMLEQLMKEQQQQCKESEHATLVSV